ncbi:MAG: glycosyltransferase [Actinobacteria bacterium]|nr:glycosyltransferase [Actinomycetota bacterium]
MQSQVAAVLVTHNSQQWIVETIASVLTQTQAPVNIVIIDDRSTDDTMKILERQQGLSPIPFTIQQASSSARSADLVVLGDHDDWWHPDRSKRQCALLDQQPQALMVASDGNLVGAEGTLRGTFPVPSDWQSITPVEQLCYTLRHSIATGGASMLRPRHFAGGLDVPKGWLHDRWWSFVAVVRSGMLIDEGIVIDYLVQAEQQVGLRTGSQTNSGAGRLAGAAPNPVQSLRKLGDLHEHLRPLAQSNQLRAQLSWVQLVRSLISG